MVMTKAKALKIAVDAMRLLKRKYAFDANMHDLYGENNPTTISASKIYNELTEAIKELEKK
jgi:hypothetical protein